MTAAVRLRDAVGDDGPAIAALHAASWRSAYRGLVPDAALGDDLPAGRLAHWRERFRALPAAGFVLLAEDEDALLGFAAVWPDPDGGPGGLLDNLHVRPDARGRGVGRLLLGASAARLAAAGRGTLHLWLVRGNAPAARFYEGLGAVPADGRVEAFPGGLVEEVRYVFRDTAALAAACAAPATLAGALPGPAAPG